MAGDESLPGPPTGGPRGADGVMAAAHPHSGYSALGSGLSIYVRGKPTILGDAPHHLQHECGGQRRRQRGGREFFWRTQT